MKKNRIYGIRAEKHLRVNHISNTEFSIDELYIIKETPKQYQVNKTGDTRHEITRLSKDVLETKGIEKKEYPTVYYSFDKEFLISYLKELYENKIEISERNLKVAKQKLIEFNNFIENEKEGN